jgi:hypothetical protein
MSRLLIAACLLGLACQPEAPEKPVGTPTPHPHVDPSNVVSAGPPGPSRKLCEPGKQHCFEGNLYGCASDGMSRSQKTACRPDSVCQVPEGGAPRCSGTCPADATNAVMAFYDCAECDWSKASFCAETGPEHTCSEVLCQQGELGFGVGLIPCERSTEGLVVPGSEKPGPCEGGKRTVEQQVCAGGQPTARARVDVCSP